MIRAMSHRFKQPPGGSALKCWLNPSGCQRIEAQIRESQAALAEYANRRAQQRAHPELGPQPAKGGFPYYA